MACDDTVVTIQMLYWTEVPWPLVQAEETRKSNGHLVLYRQGVEGGPNITVALREGRPICQGKIAFSRFEEGNMKSFGMI